MSWQPARRWFLRRPAHCSVLGAGARATGIIASTRCRARVAASVRMVFALVFFARLLFLLMELLLDLLSPPASLSSPSSSLLLLPPTSFHFHILKCGWQ